MGMLPPNRRGVAPRDLSCGQWLAVLQRDQDTKRLPLIGTQ
jgi:hypothetical protein